MGDKISNEVSKLINKYKTYNPFEICKKKGIKIKFVNYGTANIINGIDKIILINSKYDEFSKKILCAHELGHAILHSNDACNYYNSNTSLQQIAKDREANLFAAHLLFDDSNLDIKFSNMNSYLIQNFIESHLNFN